jgi:hypothetical protein
MQGNNLFCKQCVNESKLTDFYILVLDPGGDRLNKSYIHLPHSLTSYTPSRKWNRLKYRLFTGLWADFAAVVGF